MKFDIKQKGRPSNRDKSLIKLPKLPAIIALGTSTKILPKTPFELSDRITLLLQENQARNISVVNNEEIVAIVDKLSEYKCIAKRQHRQISFKCNLLHTTKK